MHSDYEKLDLEMQFSYSTMFGCEYSEERIEITAIVTYCFEPLVSVG